MSDTPSRGNAADLGDEDRTASSAGERPPEREAARQRGRARLAAKLSARRQVETAHRDDRRAPGADEVGPPGGTRPSAEMGRPDEARGSAGLSRVATAVGGVVALLVVVGWAGARRDGDSASAATTTAQPTAEVARRDLADTVAVDGGLEATDSRALYWQQPPPPPSSGGSAAAGLAGPGGAGHRQPGGDGAGTGGGGGGEARRAGGQPATTPSSGQASAPTTTRPPATTSSTSSSTSSTSSTSTTSTTTSTTSPSSTTSSSSSSSSTTSTPCPTGSEQSCTTSSTSSDAANAHARYSSFAAPSAQKADGAGSSVELPAAAQDAEPSPASSASSAQQPGGDGSASSQAEAASHTVTAAAAEGQQLDVGDEVFAIDGRPTVLLEGTQPAFRELEEGVDDGADVAQLEQNLAALGFDAGRDLTVDEHFDASTKAAVEAWQESLGVEATGRVELGDVVFSSAPVTVAVAHAAVGDAVSPGAPILEVTGRTLLAMGSLPVELLGDVHEGNPVEVTLGDGSTVTGTVRTVGGEATRPEEGDVTDSTVEVAVQLDPTDSPAARQGADVALTITTATRDDVLTVPVAAIVDAGDGQPAVRVPEGDGDPGSGRTTPVPFTPGLTASSYVEITEGPLTEGDEVLLPAPTPEP